MSLQRGSFGIEFDERPGPSQRLWWLALLIPLVAVGLLIARGCRHGAAAPSPQAGDAEAPSRQEAFEPKTVRERPSLLTHFLQSWRAAPKEAKAPAASAEPEPKEGWQAAVPSKLLSSVAKRSPEVKRLLQRAAEREAGDDWVGQRQVLRELMVRSDAEDIRAFVERKIGDINIALIFSDRAMPEKGKCRVAPGDAIAKITKRYGCTQEYVLKVNGIDRPEQLRVGREIWVLNNPVFELTVFKKNGSAVLTLNGRFLKRYAIGVGHPEDSPGGVYKVRNRARRQADDAPEAGEADAAKKSQGTCWLGLAATGDTPEISGFGLHGTWNESALGRPVDAGRIRFANADIEELYVLLPVGSQVNVAE